jgi:hypothetical protein
VTHRIATSDQITRIEEILTSHDLYHNEYDRLWSLLEAHRIDERTHGDGSPIPYARAELILAWLGRNVLQAAPPVRTAAVTVERSKLSNAAPGGRNPGWLYETTGPDGVKFDNRSIVTLREVLRRRYGQDVAITEPWKAPHKHGADANGNCAECGAEIFDPSLIDHAGESTHRDLYLTGRYA